MIHTTSISPKNSRNHKIRRNHKKVEIRMFLFVGPNVQVTLVLHNAEINYHTIILKPAKT